MQILTTLLGFTAICTITIASPYECDDARLYECARKAINEQLYQKLQRIGMDFTQVNLQDGKRMCEEYVIFRDCAGGTEFIQDCIPQWEGQFEISDFDDICNDEEMLKGWVCVKQQHGHLTTLQREIKEAGTSCEGAKKFKSETLAFLTGKCGEKIRGGMEKHLDKFIEENMFCA